MRMGTTSLLRTRGGGEWNFKAFKAMLVVLVRPEALEFSRLGFRGLGFSGFGFWGLGLGAWMSCSGLRMSEQR